MTSPLPLIYNLLSLCSISCKTFTPFSHYCFSCVGIQKHSTFICIFKGYWETLEACCWFRVLRKASVGEHGRQRGKGWDAKWKMGVGAGPMIKNSILFPAKNNGQTTLAFVIVSVKSISTLRIIHFSCLERCGLCDREMDYFVGEFKPTDGTTDGSDPNGHACGLASAPDQIPGEMSCQLSPQTAQRIQTRTDKVWVAGEVFVCHNEFVDSVCGPP